MSLETIAIASLVTTAVGGTVAAYGAYEQNKQAERVSKLNAKNAKLAAAAEESQYRRDIARKLAGSRAQYGASGVAMTGSPLLAMADMAAQAEEQALLIRYGGSVRSANYSNQAKAYGSAATTSLLAGGINTAARTGDMYVRGRQSGVIS